MSATSVSSHDRPVILGTGSYLPSRRRSSSEIEAEMNLEPGWISRRTGITERPVAADDEATSDLAVAAGTAALASSGLAPNAIGAVLLATSTPDYPLPPSSPSIAHRLGCSGAGAIDVAGACAGFLYGLAIADGLCRTLGAPVMVIGANVLSRRMDPADAATASLFADGAGAVIVGLADDGAERRGAGIEGLHLSSDGSVAGAVTVRAGGSRVPLTPESVSTGDHLMRVERGMTLFKGATQAMADAGLAAMKAAGWSPDDVDVFVPHQAGRRLMAETARRLRIPTTKMLDLVSTVGNSSAATIPIALDTAVVDGLLKPGDRVLLTAVGTGLVSAGVALTW